MPLFRRGCRFVLDQSRLRPLLSAFSDAGVAGQRGLISSSAAQIRHIANFAMPMISLLRHCHRSLLSAGRLDYLIFALIERVEHLRLGDG